MSRRALQEGVEQVNLEQLLIQYIAGVKDKENSQSELSRFIRWCGRQREVESLEANEVAAYAQFAAGASADGQRHLEPVRGLLAFAYKEGILSRNLVSNVRVSRGRGRRKEAVKSAQTQEVTLTPEGLKQVQERLAFLREERLRTIEDIRKAAADKDFRENAPLDAARERMGHLDSRIRELESLQRVATQARPKEAPREMSIAALGRRVVVRNVATGLQQSYQLVAAPEANPMGGKLSITSPVGKALLNRRVGEEVSVPTPRGTEAFFIVEVQQ
ncbi:MAG: hypothetical protein EXR55_05120 [Dehalococcoidia bacterium]|nr:hypothetical protein [Dehalococcoidia bacterium]